MKSCRQGHKIKHVQYKCTMCFKTRIHVLFLFYIFKIAHFQNELFQYLISASCVRTLAVVNCFSDEGKSEMEINYQLLQTLFIL